MIRCISMYDVGMEALTTPNSADDDAARRRLAFIIAIAGCRVVIARLIGNKVELLKIKVHLRGVIGYKNKNLIISHNYLYPI